MGSVCLNPHDPHALWLYCPSLGAAVLFAVLFGLCTVAHITQAIMFRKKFCWVIIMACLWEMSGFVLRILSVMNQTNQGVFIPQQLLIILAPLWVNAFDYMILGRMIHFFLPDQMVLGIKARRLTLLFVLLDVTAFIVQGGGGSMLSSNNDPKTIELGLHIYMGGIGLQELFIIFFSFLAISFHKKVKSLNTGRRTKWKPLLYTLYASLVLITIRVIFRLIEYSQGTFSTVTTHEAFFYCLDSVPMFISIMLFNFSHPGKVLVGPDSEFPKPEKKNKQKKKQTLLELSMV
ncbi:RTA1-domain-containing protein [Ramaria rubella]|nr:RTA1-domain-containing protein [Ramaria rubella]